MEGRQPKRRKDKYNPYEIYEKDGKYYVSFRNGEKEYKDLEIGKNVYEAFNTFELQDVSHMNVVDRHVHFRPFRHPTKIRNIIKGRNLLRLTAARSILLRLTAA